MHSRICTRCVTGFWPRPQSRRAATAAEVLGKILEAIKQRLSEAGIKAEVTGREKHLYSIYKKMLEKNLSFSQVLDIYGFRVVVEDAPACYLALGRAARPV